MCIASLARFRQLSKKEEGVNQAEKERFICAILSCAICLKIENAKKGKYFPIKEELKNKNANNSFDPKSNNFCLFEAPEKK